MTDVTESTTRVDILAEADKTISRDRAAVYGDATENHARIAVGWSQILGVKIDPHQVALCMAWVKIARLVNSPKHRDSYVDAVGYMALAGEISGRQSKEATPKNMLDPVMESAPMSYPLEGESHAIGFWAPTMKA